MVSRMILSDELSHYIHDHSRDAGALFGDLRAITYEKMASPTMQVGRVEGAFLRMIVATSGARRILEIGTFTGYSALAMASALPDDGKLLTCDIDPVATGIARTFFDKSGYGHKIEIKLGNALDTIASLPDEPLDLVFIDADKSRYSAYYEAVLPRLKRGGLILADNTLWSGRVLHPESEDDHAIVAFNALVAKDPRVDQVLLSIRDGIMMARKL
jgi:caffeoyl-CoA O-methyltransferase